jgi:hypothetical protein
MLFRDRSLPKRRTLAARNHVTHEVQDMRAARGAAPISCPD